MIDVPNNKGRMEICGDPAEVATRAADEFIRVAKSCSSKGPLQCSAVGGINAKGALFPFASSPYIEQVPWDIVHIFWGDERCVPPDHQDSNFRMTKEAMLSKVPLSQSQIYRIEAELDPAVTASKYSEVLTSYFEGLPAFDLILLGMGDDGHTASLFPGTTALHDNDHLVSAPYVEKFKTHRITLTPKVINNAALVNFLIVGDSKTKVLKEVLEGNSEPDRLPSQLIRPTHGDLFWLVDKTAASQLSFV